MFFFLLGGGGGGGGFFSAVFGLASAVSRGTPVAANFCSGKKIQIRSPFKSHVRVLLFEILVQYYKSIISPSFAAISILSTMLRPTHYAP